MKIAFINKDNYKIIFQSEKEIYDALTTRGGYYGMSYDEFEELLVEPSTRVCGIKEDGSLMDYFGDNINEKYYCIWIAKMHKMSLYKYTENGNKFIKNIDLTADIKTVAKFANKHLCSV